MIVDHPLCYAMPLCSSIPIPPIGLVYRYPLKTLINSLTLPRFNIYHALPWWLRAFTAPPLDIYASNACSSRTHASSCFFHALPFHALPFTPSRPHRLHVLIAFTPSSPSRNANAYPSEFTTPTLTPFLTTEMTWQWLFFLSLFFYRILIFILPFSCLFYVSCYHLSAIESPSCYPIPISRCSYISVSLNVFFFCSYLPKISSSFILDLELFLMFASYLTLHPCSIYTCVLGLLGGDFDCIYFLDLMVPYCTVFVDRIWCAVMVSLVFLCEEESWG